MARAGYDSMNAVRRREPWPVLVVLSRISKLVVILGVMAFGVGTFVPEQRADEEFREQVAKVEAECRELRDLAADERKLTERLRYDREYLEIVARDRLDLQGPGETIIRFKSSDEL